MLRYADAESKYSNIELIEVDCTVTPPKRVSFIKQLLTY
jgi:hypothetical protein